MYICFYYSFSMRMVTFSFLWQEKAAENKEEGKEEGEEAREEPNEDQDHDEEDEKTKMKKPAAVEPPSKKKELPRKVTSCKNGWKIFHIPYKANSKRCGTSYKQYMSPELVPYRTEQDAEKAGFKG